MFCPYHGIDHPEDTIFSDEHIIPYSIGGSNQFTIRVCKEINDKFGSAIDVILADSIFMRLERIKYNIVSHSGKSPALVFNGIADLPNGQRDARYTVSNGKHQLFIAPKVEVKSEVTGDVLYVNCTHDQLPHILQGKNKNLEKTGKGKVDEKMFYETMTVTEHDRITVNAIGEIDPILFHRPMVKIALAAAHKVFGELYSRSNDANLLRKFLHENDNDKRSELPVRGNIWSCENIENNGNNAELTKIYKYSNQHHVVVITNLGYINCFILLFGTYSGSIVLSDDPKPYSSLISHTQGIIYIIDPLNRMTTRFDHAEYCGARVKGFLPRPKTTAS